MKLWWLLCLLIVIKLGQCKNRNGNSNSIEYFTKETNNITVPIMIHFDKELMYRLAKENKFRTRNKMKGISKNILKEVEKIFRKPALKQNLKFQLLDTRFLKNVTRITSMDGDASKYLKNYCNWQGEKKLLAKKWYYSVVLTGMDLFYTHDGRIVRSSTGRGYMSGMCSIFNSCTLLEWKPRNIGYLLAHEIGHSLGMTHDGKNSHCRDNQHIMTAKYDPLRIPRTWSPCSRRDLDHYLRSKKSLCLRSVQDGAIFSSVNKNYNKNAIHNKNGPSFMKLQQLHNK